MDVCLAAALSPLLVFALCVFLCPHFNRKLLFWSSCLSSFVFLLILVYSVCITYFGYFSLPMKVILPILKKGIKFAQYLFFKSCIVRKLKESELSI